MSIVIVEGESRLIQSEVELRNIDHRVMVSTFSIVSALRGIPCNGESGSGGNKEAGYKSHCLVLSLSAE